MFNEEYNTCDWWYRVQCKEEQTSRRNEIDEEELAIDVEEDNTAVDVTKSPQRPIIIQTIIFDEEKFEDNTVSTEFGSNQQTIAINKGIHLLLIDN